MKKSLFIEKEYDADVRSKDSSEFKLNDGDELLINQSIEDSESSLGTFKDYRESIFDYVSTNNAEHK